MLRFAHRLRRAVPLPAVVLVAVLSGCGLAQHGATPTVAAEMVTVNVINHNGLDMTIYTVTRGTRARIGQVTGTTTGSFQVRLGQLTAGELQLYADPIGALRGVTSEMVHLMSGQVVEWTLETDLARSFLSVKG